MREVACLTARLRRSCSRFCLSEMTFITGEDGCYIKSVAVSDARRLLCLGINKRKPIRGLLLLHETNVFFPRPLSPEEWIKLIHRVGESGDKHRAEKLWIIAVYLAAENKHRAEATGYSTPIYTTADIMRTWRRAGIDGREEV